MSEGVSAKREFQGVRGVRADDPTYPLYPLVKSLRAVYPASSSIWLAASLRLPLRHPTQIFVVLSGNRDSTAFTKSGLGEKPSAPLIHTGTDTAPSTWPAANSSAVRTSK